MKFALHFLIKAIKLSHVKPHLLILYRSHKLMSFIYREMGRHAKEYESLKYLKDLAGMITVAPKVIRPRLSYKQKLNLTIAKVNSNSSLSKIKTK